MSPAPAFLLLSEDGSSTAPLVIKALARTICLLIVDKTRTNLLGFEPAEERMRRALSANLWKSRSPRDYAARVDLVQTIAAHLARDNGFVLFHYDGDVPYTRRRECPHDKAFGDLIIKPVSALLGQSKKLNSAQAAARLTRLIQLKPFYCIEAWTYQNYKVLLELCGHIASDLQLIQQWSSSPGLIEELERPWTHVSVKKDENLRLANTAYPADEVWKVGKSFADTVLAMLHADGLSEGLEATSSD